MVYGIGCDLCSIARMEKSLLGPHGAVFARRVFGPAEQAALGLPLAEEEGTARRTAHTVASAAAAITASPSVARVALRGVVISSSTRIGRWLPRSPGRCPHRCARE